ncbi:MAG: DHH family phosphoesterase [Chitinophagaceae bacterium]|nr:DHH family phosphoesterase [Chitinophagaceae bacterium]MCW5926985.1 DHH family phosphoesterase [Chitinophagaceae bacterium]
MEPIQEIYKLLETPRTVVVTMHQKPDPDAMGSSLALSGVLKKMGHTVTVISPTNWPEFLKWMPGARQVLDYESSQDKAVAILNQAEWIFCLDFNALHRTKHMADRIASSNAVKVLIDHHQQPELSAFTYGVSDVSKSSTCEMVYDFVVNGGFTDLIDADIAACLYAGIIGDTGSFRFPATSAAVHEMVATLKNKGLNHTAVHENLYDNFLEDRLRFIGHVLLHRMEIFYEYNTALIAVSKNDLLRYNVRTGDTEGLVNYPLTIQGIKLSALVIDRDEERKWSFRSKGNFDVNTFARKYFSGGGHFNASGGRSAVPLPEAVKQFKEAMKENETQLQ